MNDPHELEKLQRKGKKVAMNSREELLSTDGLEDFLCEGSCKNTGMCNGTEETWCGRKANAILKAINARNVQSTLPDLKTLAQICCEWDQPKDTCSCRNLDIDDRARCISVIGLARVVLATLTSTSGKAPDQRTPDDDTEIELLAYKLAGAELDYRIAYEKCGGDSINTGRAWDKMRSAGDAIRKYGDMVEKITSTERCDVPEGHELCSSCGRLFKFGETCTRGGCPCGGDV
jgi:hypothetical protein